MNKTNNAMLALIHQKLMVCAVTKDFIGDLGNKLPIFAEFILEPIADCIGSTIAVSYIDDAAPLPNIYMFTITAVLDELYESPEGSTFTKLAKLRLRCNTDPAFKSKQLDIPVSVDVLKDSSPEDVANAYLLNVAVKDLYDLVFKTDRHDLEKLLCEIDPECSFSADACSDEMKMVLSAVSDEVIYFTFSNPLSRYYLTKNSKKKEVIITPESWVVAEAYNLFNTEDISKVAELLTIEDGFIKDWFAFAPENDQIEYSDIFGLLADDTITRAVGELKKRLGVDEAVAQNHAAKGKPNLRLIV